MAGAGGEEEEDDDDDDDDEDDDDDNELDPPLLPCSKSPSAGRLAYRTNDNVFVCALAPPPFLLPFNLVAVFKRWNAATKGGRMTCVHNVVCSILRNLIHLLRKSNTSFLLSGSSSKAFNSLLFTFAIVSFSLSDCEKEILMYALLLSYTYIRPECTDTEKYKESGALVLRLFWLLVVVVLELGEVKT